MMDTKYYEEENKHLRELVNHWKSMYENLFKEYNDVVDTYDKLVMDTLKRDLANDK